MKLEGRRLSDNVEVECLGLRASLTGPAGDAAWTCLSEVYALRQAYTNPAQGPRLMNEAVFKVETNRVVREAEEAEAAGKGFMGRVETGTVDDNGMETDSLKFLIRADDLREALERRIRGEN